MIKIKINPDVEKQILIVNFGEEKIISDVYCEYKILNLFTKLVGKGKVGNQLYESMAYSLRERSETLWYLTFM